jgi:hypothetical protein
MLAPKAPTSPSEIAREIERLTGELTEEQLAAMMGDSAGVPPVPPIEEAERQPRRRKQSRLKYHDQTVHIDGETWTETIAFARPGFRIAAIRRQTCPGRRGRFVILTQRIPRRRKTNGNGGSHG